MKTLYLSKKKKKFSSNGNFQLEMEINEAFMTLVIPHICPDDYGAAFQL